jgi:hypothetical protein
LALGLSPEANAGPIAPGFDLFLTGPSTLTLHPPQPCVGSCTLIFQGLPIGPGNTDTIAQRTGSLGDGATGAIPSQLIALSLESTSPVDLGGSFFDVFVTLNAISSGTSNAPAGPPVYDALAPSIGTTTVLTNNGTGGGTFDAAYTVNADVILTAPGGNPSDPIQVVAHFPLDPFAEAVQGVWHPANPCVPNSGPGTGVCENGGFSPVSFTVTAGALALSLAVAPDPPTVLLFGSGLVGLAIAGRRRTRIAWPGSKSISAGSLQSTKSV